MPDAINKICTSLIAAKKQLKDGHGDEGIQNVRESIPSKLNADDLNKIGKKLEEELPVFAVLLHRVAAKIFKPNSTSPHGAVDWLSKRVADIRCATDRIMESESTGNSRHIAINICPKFMDELLQNLRAVKHVKSDAKALGEISCVVSITRIYIEAGKYPDVTLNENTITMCQNGLALLKTEFGKNATKHKYYGYLLNNMGEAYMQLQQFETAEKYFSEAVTVKEAVTYSSRDSKKSDIEMTKNNLRECIWQKNYR